MNAQIITLPRLHAALAIVAERLIEDLSYADVFERLEAEIALAEAKAEPNPVLRARRTIEAKRNLDAFMNQKEAA